MTRRFPEKRLPRRLLFTTECSTFLREVTWSKLNTGIAFLDIELLVHVWAIIISDRITNGVLNAKSALSTHILHPKRALLLLFTNTRLFIVDNKRLENKLTVTDSALDTGGGTTVAVVVVVLAVQTL